MIRSLALFGLASALVAFGPGAAPAEERTRPTEDGGTETFEVVFDADGNEVREGKYRRTHPDGETLAEEGRYRDGRRFGKWQSWYASGRRRSVGKYLDGVRNKGWRFYHDQRRDSLRAEGEYEDGHRVGSWEFFTADGEPDRVNTGEYRPFDGWAVADRVRGRGELIRTGPDSRWQRHGPWHFDWPGGRRMLEATFAREEPIGEWRFFHVDGTHDPRFLPAHPPPPEGETDEPLATPLDLASLRELLPPVSQETSERADSMLAEELGPGTFTTSSLAPYRRELLPALLRVLVDEPSPEVAVKGAIALRRLFPASSFTHVRLDSDFRPTLDSRELHRWFAFWWLTESNPFVWSLEIGAAGSPEPSLAPLRPALPPAAVPSGPFSASDSVALALDWLLAHQSADGSWRGAHFDAECPRSQRADRSGTCRSGGHQEHDVGLTALTVLLFQRAGVALDESDHGRAATRALAWLAGQVHDNGQIGDRLTREHVYNHAIATSALAGAVEDVRSEALLTRLRRAVDHLEAARVPYAGWRYEPTENVADVSVTGWAVGALIDARGAGLDVDESVLEDARQFIVKMSDPASGRIGYLSVGSGSSRIPGVNDRYLVEHAETITAVGLLAHLTLGAEGDLSNELEKHAELILRKPPVAEPKRLANDMYYWRAASEAFRAARDLDRRWEKRWRTWSDQMRDVAESTQVTEGHAAGSWDPVGPWGMIGGRIYSTAMMTFALLACEDGD